MRFFSRRLKTSFWGSPNPPTWARGPTRSRGGCGHRRGQATGRRGRARRAVRDGRQRVDEGGPPSATWSVQSMPSHHRHQWRPEGSGCQPGGGSPAGRGRRRRGRRHGRRASAGTGGERRAARRRRRAGGVGERPSRRAGSGTAATGAGAPAATSPGPAGPGADDGEADEGAPGHVEDEAAALDEGVDGEAGVAPADLDLVVAERRDLPGAVGDEQRPPVGEGDDVALARRRRPRAAPRPRSTASATASTASSPPGASRARAPVGRRPTEPWPVRRYRWSRLPG